MDDSAGSVADGDAEEVAGRRRLRITVDEWYAVQLAEIPPIVWAPPVDDFFASSLTCRQFALVRAPRTTRRCHARGPALTLSEEVRPILLLAFMACTSPALAAPFAFLTGGSVDFVAWPFRFASGSAIDSEGNAFTSGWIPLFIQGQLDASFASSNYFDTDVAYGTATIQGHTYPGAPRPTIPAFHILRRVRSCRPAWRSAGQRHRSLQMTRLP